MPPMNPRMPLKAPTYELANLIVLILIYEHGFETVILRSKTPTTRWAGGDATDEPEDAPGSSEAPAIQRSQHQLKTLGR